MKFSDHILPYTLVTFLILFLGASYVRFMITQDYNVAYEGECDPIENVCFIGCVDDECSEEYYYMEVQKYALDLYSECGENITDCAEANICLPGETGKCSITYCDTEVDSDACETITATDESVEATLPYIYEDVSVPEVVNEETL